MLRTMRIRSRDQGGFTLIELMVVVLILGILVAIALPTFLGARTRAQDSAAKAVLKNALTAAKAYYNEDATYDGFDTAGVPEGEESGVNWLYPSGPAQLGTVTINVADDALIVLTARSESNTYFCIASYEAGGGVPGSGGSPMVKGGVEADGATLAAPLCVIETW